MELKRLEAFQLVADMQSLSRAAIASGMAQSMVSRHIAALEAEWGRRLFDRTGRGMTLSDFGRRMYPEVKQLLEGARRLDASAREAADILTGTVHVGVLPSLSRQLLPALLADVRDAAPLVRLRMYEGFSGKLDEQLASGLVDMIVVNRYGSSALRGEDVLGRADTLLVGKKGALELSGSETLPFRALDGLPLVLPTLPNGLRSTLDVLATRRRIRLNVIAEVDTATAMKDIAISGHAFTLLPATAVAPEITSGLLAACQIGSPGIPRTIALSLTSHRPLSESARLVASLVRSLASRLLAANSR